MKRLVCVVEGKGEIQAIPNLCSRVLLALEVFDWIVDPEPVRQGRGLLVDETQPSPHRPPRSESLSRAVQLARVRPADAVLVLCDSDDDCPVAWGPPATQVIQRFSPGGAVMVVREYEAWLLSSQLGDRYHQERAIETIRDAKGPLKDFVPGYKPTVHQLELTRKIDIARLRGLSDSFDKFFRTVATIVGVAPPALQV